MKQLLNLFFLRTGRTGVLCYCRNLGLAALLLVAYMGHAQRPEVVNHKGTKLKLGVEVTTATTAPTTPAPVEGDLWYDTAKDVNNPITKIYDGTQWVRVAENSKILLDDDGTTTVQVAANAGNEKIAFSVGGTEIASIDAHGIHGPLVDGDGDTHVASIDTDGDAATANDALEFTVGGTKLLTIDNQGRLHTENANGNVGLGDAVLSNTTGNYNTAVGYQSLQNHTTGAQNVGVGYLALNASTTASGNVAVGGSSMKTSTTGGFNVAVGYASLENNTEGNDNTALGDGAMRQNTKGVGNVAVGRSALQQGLVHINNVAIGHGSQRYATDSTPAAGFWDSRNTSVGFESLRGSTTPANNTGKHNTTVGYQSMLNNTTGSDNTAVGDATMNDNTTGSNNIAMGRGALYTNVAGSQGVAIGKNAQRYVNSDSNAWTNENTAVGSEALRGAVSGQATNTGNRNTVVGYESMLENTTGDDNTAIGRHVLYENTTGSRNTSVGRNTGRGITTGSANTIIGANVDGLAGGLSNTIIIADGDGNKRIYVNSSGNMGIGTTSPTEKLHVNGNILATGSITPDFVFQKYFTGSSALKADYQFMPLEAVAEFVETNHHLPGVPSAAEVAEAGGILINRATEINLEKIEELFLHLIELKEENEALKASLEATKERLNDLENIIKN